MDKRGVPHNVLNAKQHFREAEIVAQAGRRGAVTVATNMAGRGVDIILGGNAELLAQHELAAEGVDLDSDEGQAELERRQAAIEARCRAEGEEVRKLGGLYVLGSERHESRRIDNQLRGRSGRQGDPGESRFYLSLDDELLRLFATGAMSWVMGRTLPEDVPIESKTVAKAIERAQNTVEARNAEIRKDNLKYDEVMDQQRKVIYERRLQIIDGDDLEEHTEDLLAGVAEKLVAEHCPTEFEEDWDLKALVDALMQYYPTKFTVADLEQAATTEDLVERIVEEVLDYYEKHSEAMPGGAETMRQIERDVYLQIMDARWRDHLAEMDNLKDGIHLRWTVQADPLNAWQQEGYSMFGQLMEVIDNDYLRYILHVEAVQAARRRAGPGQGRLRRRRGPGGRDRLAGRRPAGRAGGPACPPRRPCSTRRPPATAVAAEMARCQGAGQAAQRPRPRRPGAHRQGAAREGRAQRPLLVRERQEVQVLPWRRLTGPSAEAPRDFTAELEALGERLAEAERYLGREKLEVRRAELEAEVAEPDLWDDPDTRPGGHQGAGPGLRRPRPARRRSAARSDDAQALLELTEESAAAGRPRRRPRRRAGRDGRRPRDAARRARAAVAVLRRVRRVRRGVRGARRRRRHRRAGLDRDAAAHVPALGGASRLHGRGRRGDRGPGGRAAVGHLHRARPLRLRAVGHRARRAPTGAHVAVRLAAPAPDELRLHGRHARSSRTCRPRWRSTRRTCASTPTAPRVPAASTSTRRTRPCASPTCRPGSWSPCQNERSQHQNKAKAMQILGAKLAERARAERRAELDALSGDRVDNAWGNQIRSYVMAPYQLVKDLRTELRDGQRRRRARRRSRRVHGGRAAPPARGGRRSERSVATAPAVRARSSCRSDAVTCTGAGDPKRVIRSN